MSLIHLTTFIAAPIKKVFDLSRSVEIHVKGMKEFNEIILQGKTSGLLGKGDQITWQANHLFKNRKLSVEITEIHPDNYFCDEQVKGDFKKMIHKHYFKPCDNGTIMIDYFYFEAPYGIIGKLFDRLYLHQYFEKLLEKRNLYIKEVAEESPL